MGGRIQKLCALLSPCECFADVGCDHGYCARYMLENGLCKRAIITDISPKSLSKAERLLEKYVSRGACTPVCCDGLGGVEEGSADLVLIAGMGGEEILKILKNSYIPSAFVFQPMKNARELRTFLLESGCAITYDGIFCEKHGEETKYYFAIKGRSNGKSPIYTRAALEFGRDSLGTRELDGYIDYLLQSNLQYARNNLSASSRAEVEGRIKFLKGVQNGEID